MKKINTIFILISCVLFTACKISNNPQPAEAETPVTEATEWVAENSPPAQNIDRYLTSMEALGFSGAIIVSKDDEVILKKGYGYANRETRQPYTPETIQTNGSITKQFTGAAILLLESRDELSVNDKISKYLDPLSEEMQGITIHQLLTHSSGMPGGIGSDEESIDAEPYLERLKGESLQFEPGTSYAYSNTGFSLLGMIVEKVSGQNYETFLHKNLLLPAGLNETGYFLPEWDNDRLAIGYRNGERWGEILERRYLPGKVGNGPSWHYRANGGLLTTVDDMYSWFQTVKGDGVLDKNVTTRWTTGYVQESNGYSDYAYGWVSYNHEKWGKIITHNGSNGIFEADFVWLKDKDLFFYIQGNSSIVPAASLGGNIIAAAYDSTFVMPPLIVADNSADPDVAKQRAGTYYLNDGKMELTADDTRLIAKLTGQSAFDLMFDHSDEQQERFADLNTRTRLAMDKLEAGQEDAMSGLVEQDADAVAATTPLLRRINQIGNLNSLHIIGTFANSPGSRFYNSGPWTTFVYAEFENWNQYWNLIWDEDETFSADLQGPWPTFTLIPVGNNHYTGVSRSWPSDTVSLHFADECIVIADTSVCPESN